MVAADPREEDAPIVSAEDAPPPSKRRPPQNPRTVDVYPHTADVVALSRSGSYSKVQRVHLIRHAEGTHNVEKRYRDASNLDARLTDRGRGQCQDLARDILDPASSPTSGDANGARRGFPDGVELVVTSPLTRCIETALLSFPTLVASAVPFVAHEDVRETVNYMCDRRRRISELPEEFHERVDFGHVEHDHDEVWELYVRRVGGPGEHDGHRESAELHAVAERARSFLTWLGRRTETEVVVCTHSAFLRCFLSFGLEGGVPKAMRQVENCELRSMVVAHPH